MSDQTELENGKMSQILSGVAVAVEAPEAASGEKTRTLKGVLMMVVCCATPLLLFAVIPFLAATMGSLAAAGSGLLSVVALLACPVGMFLMMRMMKDKN